MGLDMPNHTQILGDYTRTEVCEILNISTTKLDEMISRGEVKSYKLGNTRRSARRIRRESVEALRNGE